MTATSAPRAAAKPPASGPERLPLTGRFQAAAAALSVPMAPEGHLVEKSHCLLQPQR